MNQVDKEKIKTGVWGAVGGATIAMIIGFGWGGWVLGSNSLDMGEEMARNAVLDRLVPICVAQFNQDPQKDAKLKEFGKLKSAWKRDQYVRGQGWATMPFEKEPDRLVADRCADLINQNS
jgi:hypothetical protein